MIYISEACNAFSQRCNVVSRLNGCRRQQWCFNQTVQHCKWPGSKHHCTVL